ncbi:MAG: DUF6272 family protein [Cyanophyceae cyanobacterium]
MVQIFGEYLNNFPPDHDSLVLTFTPSSLPIKKRWRNNRLSAQFVAEYLATFLPVDDEDPLDDRRLKESKGAMSYIANELLENAMKFNDETARYRVRFGIHFLEKEGTITAVIFATNSVNKQRVEKFQAFIEEILNCDPTEMYITQIEKSAEDEHSNASGLGLLTMINDYSAKLGWQFKAIKNDPSLIAVTTMAQIAV